MPVVGGVHREIAASSSHLRLFAAGEEAFVIEAALEQAFHRLAVAALLEERVAFAVDLRRQMLEGRPNGPSACGRGGPNRPGSRRAA